MNKIKTFIMDKLPIIGFMLFALGGTYFVIGHDQSITHLSVSGGLACLIGFFLFVYGNMRLSEQENN